jgi:hypothetical protein
MLLRELEHARVAIRDARRRCDGVIGARATTERTNASGHRPRNNVACFAILRFSRSRQRARCAPCVRQF